MKKEAMQVLYTVVLGIVHIKFSYNIVKQQKKQV